MKPFKTRTIKGKEAVELKAFLESLCGIPCGGSKEVNGFEITRLR